MRRNPRDRKASVPDKSEFNWPNFGVSILGGVAAAAVGAVVMRGGFGGVLFAHLAPLPLMIVALGFGIGHGATAAIVAAIILSIYPHPVIGMGYAMLVAVPAWLAAYAASGAPRNGRDILTRNVPGWASLAPAAMLALAIITWLIVATLSFGSIDEALNPIRARAFILLDNMVRDKELPEGVDATVLSGAVARAVPAFLAAYGALIHILNLWIAGRLAQGSGLLTRPWPDIAQEFRLPRIVGGLFVSGLALTFFEGPSGPIGLVLSATMGLLLALQGLAVTHVLLRGKRASALVLGVIYFMLGLIGWPIVFLAALGAVDLVANLRDRKAAASPPLNQNSAQKPD